MIAEQNSEPMPRGDEGDLGAIKHAELAHDLAHMNLHGRLGHAKLVGDGLIGIAYAKTLDDSLLPRGQLMLHFLGTVVLASDQSESLGHSLKMIMIALFCRPTFVVAVMRGDRAC